MNMFRRILSFILTVSLLCGYVPAYALGTPVVSMYVTPSSDSLGVGDTLTVELTGVNTVDYALQVVLPDSTQAFYDEFPAVVPLAAEGMYVLIGYGVNTTDTTDPGFLRAMSDMQMFDVSGISAEIPTGSLSLKVLRGNQWVSPADIRLDAENVRVQAAVTGDEPIPGDAVLTLSLLDDRNTEHPLLNAALQDVAQQQADGSWLIEVSDYGLAANLLRKEYTEQDFSLKADLTLSGMPLAQAAGTFRINSYTNEMRYVNQFYDSNFTLGATETGAKLLAWLDMSERTVHERTNSGYLMLEQEYLHQQSLGYTLGYGYVVCAKTLLETIGSLGMNAVSAVVEDVICRAKFAGAGKSAIVYYQMLVDTYADYANRVIEETMLLDQAFLDLEKILGSPITLVDEQNNTALVAVQTKSKDIACFKPATYQGTTITYRLEDMKIQDNIVSFVVSGAEGGGFVMEMTPWQMLSPTSEGIAVRIDTSLLVERYGFDIETEFLVQTDWLKRVTDAEAAKYPIPYSAEWVSCDIETAQASKSYQNLDVDIKTRINNLLGKLENALDAVSTGLSSVTYLAALGKESVRQKALFTMLAETTDEYLSMLEVWEASAALPGESKNEDVVAAVRALRQDVLATESDLASAIAQAGNTFVLTSDGFTDIALDVVQKVADKLGLGQVVKQKLAAGAQALANKLGGKAAQVFSGLKLPNLGLLVIQIGSIVLSMMSEEYLSFHENVKAVYALKDTLTMSMDALLRSYGREPTHEKALMIIAALETLKSIKQIGEKLIEAYYLEDLYADLDMDNMPKVRTVIWNEIMMRSGTEELNLDRYCTPFAVVYEDIDAKIDPREQYKYYPGEKTYPSTVLHGYYALDAKHPVVYKGKTLDILPEQFRQVWVTYQSMYYGIRLGRGGIYAHVPPLVDLRQEKAWWDGQSVPVQDMKRVYRDYMYLYRGANGLEVDLNRDQYDTVLDAGKEINRILTSYTDDRTSIEWYNFKAKDEQQHQQRILWTKITNKYIESFRMYDPAETY